MGTPWRVNDNIPGPSKARVIFYHLDRDLVLMGPSMTCRGWTFLVSRGDKGPGKWSMLYKNARCKLEIEPVAKGLLQEVFIRPWTLRHLPLHHILHCPCLTSHLKSLITSPTS